MHSRRQRCSGLPKASRRWIWVWIRSGPAVGRWSHQFSAQPSVDALCRAYQALGFDRVLDGDEALRDLVLARIIEPTSKVDAIRVLAETGVESASCRTIKRRLLVIAKREVRQALSGRMRGPRRIGAGIAGAV
jgi:hypothetical protein